MIELKFKIRESDVRCACCSEPLKAEFHNELVSPDLRFGVLKDVFIITPCQKCQPLVPWVSKIVDEFFEIRSKKVE